MIPYSKRLFHTLVSGSTGSGKTTLAKTVIKSTIQNRNDCQIILEPQGSFSVEVKNFKCLNDEDIVYFEPKINPTHTPVLNFLEKRKDQDAHSLAMRLARMLSVIIDGEHSPPMLSLLRPCLTVLIEEGGYSLADLKRFMLKDENEDLIELGMRYPDKEFQSTFKRINDAYFNRSKHAVISKLDTLLQDRDFRNITSGKSTIDLKKHIDDGKVIIFNLGNLELDTKKAFGRLLTAMITHIAFARKPNELKHAKRIHYYVDELQNFLSSDMVRILDEARQKKLHLFALHQRVGQLKSHIKSNQEENFIDSFIGNSGIKIIGHNESPDTLNLYSTKLGIDKENLHKLKNYHFRLRVRGRTDIEFRSSNGINSKSNYIYGDELARRNEYLLDTYYRPIGTERSFKSKLYNTETTDDQNDEIILPSVFPDDDDF